MENKKGSGIFLGIVSVSTLIVAIIGATFAYFSASTESNDGAIGLQAYEYKLSLDLESVYPKTAAALIPLDPNKKLQDEEGNFFKFNGDRNLVKIGTEDTDNQGVTNLQYALQRKDPLKRCIDDSGLQVCALYKVTIENGAGNAVTLKGELETTMNMPGAEGRQGFVNLTYQPVTCTGEVEDDSLACTPTKNSKTIAATPGELIEIDPITVEASQLDNGEIKPGVGVSYVLIYLNNVDSNQLDDMGASFKAKLRYTSTDGGNSLSGTFTLSADDIVTEGE